MSTPNPSANEAESIKRRAVALYDGQLDESRRHTDRMFAWLMAFQWVVGIVMALFLSPRTWEGTHSEVHIHVWAAVFLGGVISGFPIFLVWRHPGETFTRHAVAVGQMLTSALLIHLSGGRIETHFHIFGSLAFLAFYQDSRVLVTATIVVALDHALRGIFWPVSVFGVLTASPWRWVEHAGWVVFEDVFLILSIRKNLSALFHIAEHRAVLEALNQSIERKIEERTCELSKEIVDRKRAESDRQSMEIQLRHAQKLEAVGQLAAGIAHEINTPIQYIGDNARFFGDSWGAVEKILGSHNNLIRALKEKTATPEMAEAAVELVKANELDYYSEQTPSAIAATLEGVDRISKIISAMKEFSHPGGREKSMVDVNHAIRNTTVVAENVWKSAAEMNLELAPDLPKVPCFISGLNQSILNLVVNAAQAIQEAVKHQPDVKGTITIQTLQNGDDVEIRVTDTGCGIPESARPHIFEPFFTTKDVGHGTGQGLSIVYGVIVKNHGGTVRFESQVGRGTTFIIRLPLALAEPVIGIQLDEAEPALSVGQ